VTIDRHADLAGLPPTYPRCVMDQDRVILYIVMGPPDNVSWTYSPIVYRWRARDMCRDFAAGTEWLGRPVMRALIVDYPKQEKAS
jgi:hypothetical protein